MIAEPDILGAHTFYIEDATGGIKVVVGGDSPDLSEGDVIRIEGAVGQEAGNPKINVKNTSTIVVLRSQDPIPSEVALSDVGIYLHRLVRITGTVASVQGATVTIEDQDGNTAIVYFKRTTGMSKPAWQEGDTVTVVGIVDEVSGEVRVLPRRQEDVAKAEVLGVTEEAESGSQNSQEMIEVEEEGGKTNTTVYIVGGLLAVGGVVGWMWRERRISKIKNQI